MTLEQYVLRTLLNSEGYQTYRDYINLNSLETNMKRVVIIVDKLYEGGTKEIHIEDLKAMYISSYPSTKEDVLNLIFSMLESVYEIDDSTIAFKEVIQNFVNKQVAAEIGEISLKYIEDPDKFSIEELENLIEKYDKTQVDEDDGSLKKYTLKELLDNEGSDIGHDWFSKDITMMAGKLRPQTLIVVVAPPDTGKSAFCHSALTHFAKSVRVLHINNEERDTKVSLRARQCYTNMTKEEIEKDEEKNERLWSEIKDNWFHRDKADITLKDIENYIITDKPEVVLIDMLQNIIVKDESREDLMEERRAAKLREFAKKYNLAIICTKHSDAEGYDKDFLSMKNMRGSKVGIQGAADIQFGLTRKPDSLIVNVSMPKGKESGNSHLTTCLELNKQTSRMEEV